jgi:twitching motility protein PilT
MEIEQLLAFSVSQGASDLHLLPNLSPLLRIQGELAPMANTKPLPPEIVKRFIYSLLTKQQWLMFEKELVLDLGVYLPDVGNFRVSIFHQIYGVAAVFRVIPNKVPSYEELLLPVVFKRFLSLSHGLVLIAGATGSGKSTTLAAMVDFVNETRACHIITIEDPIEFIYVSKKSAINQIQVGRDTPNFATALRASLRQDPDVILLGEMRDLDTIRLALTASETGHLVFSTIHASSAPLAISRMVDMFPADEKNRIRKLLSETIRAIICQMLVKRITGGRVAAFEIMLSTPAIRHLIYQDMVAQMETTIQTSGDVGMCTMAQYLQKLGEKHIITLAEARSTLAQRETFKPPHPDKRHMHK